MIHLTFLVPTPPLPARHARYSVILMVSMFYFTYYYSTIDALIYICSLFAFGISIFQLNSPMDTKHAFCFCLVSALNGYGLGEWLDSERSFGWVVVFVISSSQSLYTPLTASMSSFSINQLLTYLLF